MGDTRLFAYVGQSRSQRWIHLLESYGFGEMVCRGEMPPRRTPWAFDNGAFKDWDKKSPMPPEAFDVAKYERDLDYHWLHGKTNPDFMVAPDLPMNGLESLRFSEQWLPKLRAHKVPVYLVLQDGMTEADVKAALGGWSGLFVGGSLPWKLRTSKQWVDFAHANGLRCHIGRMGTEARVRAAMRWGGRLHRLCTAALGRSEPEALPQGLHAVLHAGLAAGGRMSPVTVAVLLIFGALAVWGLLAMAVLRLFRRGQSAETEERPAPWVGRGPEVRR